MPSALLVSTCTVAVVRPSYAPPVLRPPRRFARYSLVSVSWKVTPYLPSHGRSPPMSPSMVWRVQKPVQKFDGCAWMARSASGASGAASGFALLCACAAPQANVALAASAAMARNAGARRGAGRRRAELREQANEVTWTDRVNSIVFLTY